MGDSIVPMPGAAPPSPGAPAQVETGSKLGPYSVTSRAHGMTMSKKESIAEYLHRIDDMWAKESPLHEEWRNGSAGKKGFFDPLGEAFLNLVASTRIYMKYLVTMEAWLVALVSVGATLLFSLYEINGQRLAVNVSWAFISFAIIFPLTNSLNETFRRREQALACMAEVKAFLLSYYQAHRDWDWTTGNGRKNLPKNHVAQIRFIVTQLIIDMRDILTCPPTSRQVHYHTKWGRTQRSRMQNIQREINQRIAFHFDRISMAVEELKYAGQPGNESSRMRQYVTLTMKNWEKLKYIKKYRTPIATRAFARVYIFLHPIFWGPYYAHLVESMLNDEDPEHPAKPKLYSVICANVYACTLSVLTSLAMMGLFNVRYRLEDPFCSDTSAKALGADQIHVKEELGELLHNIAMEFTDADQNPCGGGPARSCYPLPDDCQIANLEIGTRISIITLKEVVNGGK